MEENLRPIEVDTVIDQFHSFYQDKSFLHLGENWFAGSCLYHVHKVITNRGTSQLNLHPCGKKTKMFFCTECGTQAPDFVQLWAKLNKIYDI